MEIKFNRDITDIEKTDLIEIFNCEADDLNNHLVKMSEASFEEYLSMFLGQKVFKRGSDILEYRLFLLIEKFFDKRIPNEQDVCRLFQSTSSESRSLIRSVISKYQYSLKSAIESSVKDAVSNAKKEDGEHKYTVIINSKNIVDELNRKLADLDGNLPSVSKKRGSVSTYEISPSSYEKLCDDLGIDCDNEVEVDTENEN